MISNKLLEVINVKRSGGLPPLSVDAELCRISEERLNEIKKDFSHEGFALNRCASCITMGEVLARNFQDDEKVVEEWLNSTSHREVIMSNRYDIGCAVKSESHYVVTMARKSPNNMFSILLVGVLVSLILGRFCCRK